MHFKEENAMVKTKLKKAVSLMLATVMSLPAFMSIGATTAFAAIGEKADVYLLTIPEAEILTITVNGDTAISTI